MTPKLDFELRVNTRQKTSVQIKSTQLSANISQRVLTFSFFFFHPPILTTFTLQMAVLHWIISTSCALLLRITEYFLH